jgi:hypothetical protein
MVIPPEEPAGLGELSPFSRTDLRSLNVSDGNLTGSAIIVFPVGGGPLVEELLAIAL